MKKHLLFLFAFVMLMAVGVQAQNTCLQPANFTATKHQPSWQNVQLNWSAPEVQVPEIRWCAAFTTGIGMNAAATLASYSSRVRNPLHPVNCGITRNV